MSSHNSSVGFETLSQSFVQWLQGNGTVISPKVSLSDLRHVNAGRGLLATADIQKDEELFSIPKLTILTAETSSIPTEIGQQLQEPWLQLILAMIYEYQQGPASKWKAYFDVLPTELDTLMYWSDDELQLLRGSAVVNKLGKTHADETFSATLIPLIRQHPTTFNAELLTETHLLSLCHRMGSTIMAYAFDLDPDPSATQPHKDQQDGWEEDSADADADSYPAKGMIPLADMLNADATRNNARLFHEDDKVVMKAIRPIRAGEEVFNDYGPLPRADLLRRYGYVTDYYAKYDVVEIGLDFIKDVVLAEEEQGEEHVIPPRLSEDDIEARLRYLDEHDVLDDGYDIHHPSTTTETEEDEGTEEQFPDELKILLHTLVLPSSEFEKLAKKDRLPKPQLTPELLVLLHNVLVKRRDMYPIAPVTDTPADGHARYNLRRNMAAQVIAGEKAVLDSAISTVSDLTADANDKKRKADEDDGPARKKQK